MTEHAAYQPDRRDEPVQVGTALRRKEHTAFARHGDGTDRNDHETIAYLLTLSFLGMIALSGLLWWTSVLTGGHENGGRYDVPAVNGAAWWGFLVSIPAVLVVGNHCMTRLEQWIDSRRRRRQANRA